MISDVDHDALRGELREIISRQLLEPLLPPSWEIGTGEICPRLTITSHRRTS